MRNFPSCHTHPNSLDTASTPEAFAQRELELETGVLVATDHGTMQACRKIYDLAKKHKLTPILGLEAYLRDDDCPILAAHGIPKDVDSKTGATLNSYRDYNKYYHVTIHALDNEAYEALSRRLSHAWLSRIEHHGSESKPIFTWADLEYLGNYNITMTSGCLVGMVARHLLSGQPEIAVAYYERLRSIPKAGNFYVELHPHRCTHDWVQGIFIELEGGSRTKYWEGKKFKTDQKDEITAKDLAADFKKGNRHATLIAVKDNRTWNDVNKPIVNVEHIEGFIQNECQIWCPDGDVQLGANHVMSMLAAKYGDTCLIADDSHYATRDEHVIQNIRLAQSGSWRFFADYHRQSGDDAWAYFSTFMGTDQQTFDKWIDNSRAWAERFKGFAFKKRKSIPASFYPSDTLGHMMSLIEKQGRMDWGNQAMVTRLREEIDRFYQNGTMDLLPYFMIDEEVCSLYEDAEELTGPGRGSAGGVLLSYLIGVTHIDPLEYGLSLDRFLTLDRIQSGKFPDIDQDLPHRDLLVGKENEGGWLQKRFGEHVAQISADTKFKLKLAIKDVTRARLGYVPGEIEVFTKGLPNPPQGIDDHSFVFGYEDDQGSHVEGLFETDSGLKTYASTHTEDWKNVTKMLGLTRSKTRHAAGYVIADEPVANFIPLMQVSGVPVTQYDMRDVEAMGGLKMDFLVITVLQDIGHCIKLVQERKGIRERLHKRNNTIQNKRVPRCRILPHPMTGELLDIWNLPPDTKVFNDVASGNTETVFQFNTVEAKRWLKEFNYEKAPGIKAIDSVNAMAAFTALDRPGPLDAKVGGDDGHNMLVEFANRAKGLTPTEPIDYLNNLLPETYGVIVFQEQLQRVFHELSGCTALQANKFREKISKKIMDEVRAMKPMFMAGAAPKIGEDVASRLWSQIETFGQYGFNKSHAVAYALIGYVTAYLKYHYPLEWWTSVLRHADKTDIAEKFWRYCGKLVKMPDILDSRENFEIEGEMIRAPLRFLDGVGAKSNEELTALHGQYRNIEEFCQAIEARRVAGATMKTTKKGPKLTKARTALNVGVVSKLILSGAMDSLFPPGLIDLEKLEEYTKAMAKASGSKPAPIDKRYLNLTPVRLYQIRKSILPIYSDNLIPLVYMMGVPEIIKTDTLNGPTYTYKIAENHHVDMLTADEFFDRSNNPLFSGSQEVAVVANVREVKKFDYVPKKGQDRSKRRAIKIILEVDGGIYEFVRWPGKNSKIASALPDRAVPGALCVIVLSRWDTGRDFSLSGVFPLVDPLELEVENDDDDAA